MSKTRPNEYNIAKHHPTLLGKTVLDAMAKRVQQQKSNLKKKKFKLQTIRILGPTFAQICVRESNSVLQAIQTNQSLFIKLGNKRHVLGFLTECLTEIKFRKTLSNIVKHGGQTSKTRFYKTMWDVLRGCFTLDRPLICPLLWFRPQTCQI